MTQKIPLVCVDCRNIFVFQSGMSVSLFLELIGCLIPLVLIPFDLISPVWLIIPVVILFKGYKELKNIQCPECGCKSHILFNTRERQELAKTNEDQT